MRAAVSVISIKGQEIILIKRAQREEDPWSGHIGFPGGREELSDEQNPFYTAIRETKEEIGIQLSSNDLTRGLTPLLPDKDFRGYKLELWPFFFEVNNDQDFILDHNEVDKIIRLPQAKVTKDFKLSEREFTIFNGQKLQLPCLELDDGSLIWGLSLMILTELNRLSL